MLFVIRNQKKKKKKKVTSKEARDWCTAQGRSVLVVLWSVFILFSLFCFLFFLVVFFEYLFIFVVICISVGLLAVIVFFVFIYFVVFRTGVHGNVGEGSHQCGQGLRVVGRESHRAAARRRNELRGAFLGLPDLVCC
jgi:hypothetical protein